MLLNSGPFFVTVSDIWGVFMLVRIVYYLENTLPEERIIVTNDRKNAERIALEGVKKLKARDYEIEWVA